MAGMTDHDKKLLAGLGVFCVIAAFVHFVFLPLGIANASLKNQIREQEALIAEIQQKEASLFTARLEYEKRQRELARAQEGFYPLLKRQEIDRILTTRAMDCGLFVRSLQMLMPDKASGVPGFLSEKDVRNPDGEEGVWIAQVTLELAGSETDLDTLMDEIVMDMPGVRLMGFLRVSGHGQEGFSGEASVWRLQLEVLMCRKD